MALGVLVEAGSRLAAENARASANRAEQELRDQARRELDGREVNRKAERLAAAEASRRKREWTRLAGDEERLRDYLAGLPFQEVARHWGQAARPTPTLPTPPCWPPPRTNCVVAPRA